MELGFDAIPDLMAHIQDTRLTRSQTGSIRDGLYRDVMRVNQPVEYILNKLSGERFSNEHYWATQDDWKPPKEHKWWAEARKVGEEKWLLDNVLPKDREQEPFPNHIILRVIRAKYPHRLKDVYQTLLDKHSSVYGEQIVQAIMKSKLTRKEKIAILEQGAKSNIHLHRYDALEGLAVLDMRVFQTHLLQFMKGLPQDLEFGPNSYNNEITVISLIRKTDDRNCWRVLTDLSHRVSPTTRLCFIRIVSWPSEAMEPNPNQECIRYLLDFANDTARGADWWTECPVVRDYAAIRLASLLGLVSLESQKLLRSPREISLLRDRVRELAERELAGPIK